MSFEIYKNKMKIFYFCIDLIFTFVIQRDVKIKKLRRDISMETIKDRLAHILRSKNLTAKQFAELMEIQPSNVSHLLNGRNKPSLDFLLKLKEVFPEYSFDWIIMGKKPITISEPASMNYGDNNLKFEEINDDIVDNINENAVEPVTKLTDIIDDNKEIDKIILVYSDKTFEVIFPSDQI